LLRRNATPFIQISHHKVNLFSECEPQRLPRFICCGLYSLKLMAFFPNPLSNAALRHEVRTVPNAEWKRLIHQLIEPLNQCADESMIQWFNTGST
jgi:hypothetical protein